jgi:hypothetical protein
MKSEVSVALITETIESMVGHSYKYGNAVHRVSGFRIIEEKERVYVKTDKREFDRDFESVMSFLNQLDPIEERAMEKYHGNEEILPVAQINSSVITECKNILMDSIKKIQGDSKYIEQAAAIKENVDTIIELGKTEIQQLDLLYKLKRKGDI